MAPPHPETRLVHPSISKPDARDVAPSLGYTPARKSLLVPARPDRRGMPPPRNETLPLAARNPPEFPSFGVLSPWPNLALGALMSSLVPSCAAFIAKVIVLSRESGTPKPALPHPRHPKFQKGLHPFERTTLLVTRRPPPARTSNAADSRFRVHPTPCPSRCQGRPFDPLLGHCIIADWAFTLPTWIRRQVSYVLLMVGGGPSTPRAHRDRYAEVASVCLPYAPGKHASGLPPSSDSR